MTSETVIISPELTAGGVGDHTRRLLQNLPRLPSLRLIVPKIGNRPLNLFEGYPVIEIDRSAQALCERLPKDNGKVLVQYSGYGFNIHGCPRWLIKGLLEWKKQARGRLALMFHEIWTFWPIWNRNYLLQRLHRRDLGRLVRAADAILTSTPDQASHLTDLSPRSSVQVLPVGSNIERLQISNETREPGLAVLFGLQQSRIRTLRRMFSDLRILGTSQAVRKIVTVGAGQSETENEEELALLLELDLVEGFDQRGPLPEDKISTLLLAAAFGISSQDDRSVLKSSTLMAYAAHGMNVVSCYADASKPEPLSLMISPAELMRGIPESELQLRGEKLRHWQERTSNWARIAGQVASALKL